MTVDPSVIIAFMTALIGAIGTVARFAYTEMRNDRDWWRQRYMDREGIAAKAVDIAVAEKAKSE
jgi:hypothetical protein